MRLVTKLLLMSYQSETEEISPGFIGRDPDAGRDWGQEEKGTTEDEMAGWHHGLNGREFGLTPGLPVH